MILPSDYVILIIVLLVGHFIADFLLQSRKMALEKSEDPWILLAHILIIGAGAWIPGYAYVGFINLTIINPLLSLAGLYIFVMAFHALIDWNIWRWYKRHRAEELKDSVIEGTTIKFKYWEDGLFYKVIGFDQLLHQLTLVIGVLIFF